MEPDLVPYSPILHRPPLRWPNGARVALWVVPNIEHYEYLPKFVRTRDAWPRSPHPDILGYTQRDYGNRVGLWRLFDLTDAFGHPLHRQPEHGSARTFPGDPRSDGGAQLGVYVARHLQHALPLEFLAMMKSVRRWRKAGTFIVRLTGRRQRGWFSPAITNTLRYIRGRRRMRLRLYGRSVS